MHKQEKFIIDKMNSILKQEFAQFLSHHTFIKTLKETTLYRCSDFGST